jgi:hypothetical protein
MIFDLRLPIERQGSLSRKFIHNSPAARQMGESGDFQSSIVNRQSSI